MSRIIKAGGNKKKEKRSAGTKINEVILDVQLLHGTLKGLDASLMEGLKKNSALLMLFGLRDSVLHET